MLRFCRQRRCFCQKLDTKPGVSRILSRQLLRSGTSVGANVEEAQAAQSTADIVSKCSISLREARESNYWLRLLEARAKMQVMTSSSWRVKRMNYHVSSVRSLSKLRTGEKISKLASPFLTFNFEFLIISAAAPPPSVRTSSWHSHPGRVSACLPSYRGVFLLL